jgi:hypothetical protein
MINTSVHAISVEGEGTLLELLTCITVVGVDEFARRPAGTLRYLAIVRVVE